MSQLKSKILLETEDDPVYSSTPAPYCSSSGWCGRPWFAAKEDPPKSPRIGQYDADGQWNIPENIRNSTGFIVHPGDDDVVNAKVNNPPKVGDCSVSGLDENKIRCTA